MKLTFFNLLLGLHITGGLVSLLTGMYILFVAKGTPRHRLLGKIYFYAMLTSAGVALPMSVLRPKPFLFIIGVFSLYMLLTARLYLYKRKKEDVQISDWVLAGLMFIFACAFMYLGASALLRSNSFGVVFIIFGFIAMLFVFQDQRHFRSTRYLSEVWKTSHLQRMIGSYISAATAFLVVNNTFLPPVIAWILPTALLVPLIIYWSRKYQST